MPVEQIRGPPPGNHRLSSSKLKAKKEGNTSSSKLAAVREVLRLEASAPSRVTNMPTNGNESGKHRPAQSQQNRGQASSPGRGGPAGSGGRGIVTRQSNSGRGGPPGRGGGRGPQSAGGRSGGRSGRQLSSPSGRGGRGTSPGRHSQTQQHRAASAALMQQQQQQRAGLNGDGRPRLVRSGQQQSHPASTTSLGLSIGPDPAMLRASQTSLYQSRIRDGLCPTCGIQLFEMKKPGLLSKRSSMKRIPINIDGVVFGGQCLKCNRPGGPATPTAKRGSSDPDFSLDGSHPLQQAAASPSERNLHYHAHMQPDAAVPPGAHMHSSHELNASLNSFEGHGSGSSFPQPQQQRRSTNIPPQQQQSNRSISLRSFEGIAGESGNVPAGASAAADTDGISAIPSIGQDFSTDDKKRQLLIEQEILLNQFHASKMSQMSLDQSALHGHIAGDRRAGASADAGGATAVETTASPDHRSYDKGVGVEINRPFGPNGGLGRQSSSRRGTAIGRQGSNDRMLSSVNEADFRRLDSNDADPMDEVDELAIKAINPDDAMVKEQMRIMEQIQKQNEATERRVADKALNMSGELNYTDKFAEQDENDKAKAQQQKNAEPSSLRAEADKGAGAQANDSDGKLTVDIDLLDSNSISDNIAAFVVKPKGEARTMEAWSKEWMGVDNTGNADKDQDNGAAMSEEDRKDAERRRRRREEKARRASGDDIPKDIEIDNHDSGSEISMGDARDALKKQKRRQKQERRSSQTEDLLAMDEDDIRKQEAILRDIDQKKHEKKNEHHHHGHARDRSKGKGGSADGGQPPVPMTIAVPPDGGNEVGTLSNPNDLDDDLRDGCTYTGDFNADGLRHGRGTLEWVNGDKYEGQFFSGMRHGVGKLMFADGELYICVNHFFLFLCLIFKI